MALIACGYVESENWWKKPFGSGAILFAPKEYKWLKENEISFIVWNGLNKPGIDAAKIINIHKDFESICYEIKEFEAYDVSGYRCFTSGYHMLIKAFNNDIPIAERYEINNLE